MISLVLLACQCLSVNNMSFCLSMLCTFRFPEALNHEWKLNSSTTSKNTLALFYHEYCQILYSPSSCLTSSPAIIANHGNLILLSKHMICYLFGHLVEYKAANCQVYMINNLNQFLCDVFENVYYPKYWKGNLLVKSQMKKIYNQLVLGITSEHKSMAMYQLLLVLYEIKQELILEKEVVQMK